MSPAGGADGARTFSDTSPELLERVAAWREQDPDDATRAELDGLIARGDVAALEERFTGRLQFGTAGLRGELGAGPQRMNRVLVAQAAAGLAAHLGAGSSIVVGYDGRHNSEVFAKDTAEIMQGAGVIAHLMPRMLPTPVLAFAVRHLGVSAGVMVTASHNPARDNGYKVYLGGSDGGSQIVPPVDAEIAARIDAVGDIRDLPRSDAYATVGEDLIEAYVAATAELAGDPAGHASRDVGPWVYTAMHGVGFETAAKVFSAAGFGAPASVAAQQEPDPDFPTVSFPNPEEPGALDLAMELARSVDAELIVANDPDADRLAIAIPERAHLHPAAVADDDAPVTGWRRLTGNEVGQLLGWRAARTLAGSKRALAASVVSSPALRDIAEEYDLPYVETLTGFKWISRAPELGYGYEEALGYLVNPDTVRDKDGISAAVAFLDLVADLRAEGSSLAQHQRDFDERFGAYASAQVSLRVTDLARIGELMTRLRTTPPAHVGPLRVHAIDDFASGLDGLPPNDILRLRLDDGARVIVRPSGTEPKLKVYIDASSASGTVEQRRRAAQDTVDELERGMRSLLA